MFFIVWRFALGRFFERWSCHSVFGLSEFLCRNVGTLFLCSLFLGAALRDVMSNNVNVLKKEFEI